MISIKEALRQAAILLKNVAEHPQNEARILLCHILRVDKLYLVTHDDQMIDEASYFDLVQRRVASEPIEYITQSASFYSRDFFVQNGVLIPRPETEILVEITADIIQQNGYKNIIEIGVGSGIISVMLALLCDIKITATDINPQALSVAKINAKRFGVEDKITFVQTSYMDEVDGTFDLLVSNPPYIANDFAIDKNLTFEPSNALFGGIKGHEMLYDIIDIWQQRAIKHIACEMGYDQKNIILQKLPQANFYQDLAGFDRGFIAKNYKGFV